MAKEKWMLLITSVEPHAKSLITKSIEVYDMSKTAVTPHMDKVKEFVDPHFPGTYLKMFIMLLLLTLLYFLAF